MHVNLVYAERQQHACEDAIEECLIEALRMLNYIIVQLVVARLQKSNYCLQLVHHLREASAEGASVIDLGATHEMNQQQEGLMLLDAGAVEEEGRDEVHALDIADPRVHMCICEEHIKQGVASAGDCVASFITEQTAGDIGAREVHLNRVF